MKILTIASVIMLYFGGNAHAWDALVEEPDVFGKVKVVATENSINQSLVVQCDSEAELFLAVIVRKKEFEDVTEAPAKLYVQTSDAGPAILEASFRNWNDNYAAVVASGRELEIINVISAIGSAKKKIKVGYEVLGLRESANFSSRNSKATVETIFEKCKLSQPTQ
jgi:hypothetical protein